jgi:hypothetical protein
VSTRSSIEVRGLPVEIVRKDIKNLHLGVYPPGGRVRVAAPLCLNDDAVRLAIITRLGWIKRQQNQFADQDRQSAREFVSGESHYYQGHRYRLSVIHHDGPAQVVVRNKTRIDLYMRPGANIQQRERVFVAWYRSRLKEQVPALIQKWAPVMEIEIPDWGVKDMKTKWGACNTQAYRIWLNLELIKKPPHCLEYIIMHEMVHLLERRHNDRFISLMNAFLPQWRLYRDELNRFPLAHETWTY